MERTFVKGLSIALWTVISYFRVAAGWCPWYKTFPFSCQTVQLCDDSFLNHPSPMHLWVAFLDSWRLRSTSQISDKGLLHKDAPWLSDTVAVDVPANTWHPPNIGWMFCARWGDFNGAGCVMLRIGITILFFLFLLVSITHSGSSSL